MGRPQVSKTCERLTARTLRSKLFAFLAFTVALTCVLLRQKSTRLMNSRTPRKVAFCALGSLNTLAIDCKVQRGLLRHVLKPLHADLFIHGDRNIDESAMYKDLVRVNITSLDIELMQRILRPKKLQLETIMRQNYTDMSPSCLKDIWFNRGAQRMAPLFEHAKKCLELVRRAEHEMGIVYDWVFFARSDIHYTSHTGNRNILFPDASNVVLGSTNGATTLNMRVSLVPRHYAESFTSFVDHLLGLTCDRKPTSGLCDKPYTDECLHTWYHGVANGRRILSLNTSLKLSLRRRCGEHRECVQMGKRMCRSSNSTEFCRAVRRYYRLRATENRKL